MLDPHRERGSAPTLGGRLELFLLFFHVLPKRLFVPFSFTIAPAPAEMCMDFSVFQGKTKRKAGSLRKQKKEKLAE